MKRLFLASSGLGYIKKFVGGDASGLRMLFVPTAGNLDEDVWWIDKDRDVLSKVGFQITELDIASASQAQMKQTLKSANIVYVAGGNTFYLLKQVRESGFDVLLTNYVDGGGLYAGASAGALIAGLDIKPVETIDEPEKVSGLVSTRGLGFVDIVPIPHYDFEDRAGKIDAIKRQYDGQYTIVLLNDDQAIDVEDGSYQIVDSPRSELELGWLHRAGKT